MDASPSGYLVASAAVPTDVPLSLARPAVAAAVTHLAKADAYQAWLEAQEQKLLATAICGADDVPAAMPVELTDYLPFLALS